MSGWVRAGTKEKLRQKSLRRLLSRCSTGAFGTALSKALNRCLSSDVKQRVWLPFLVQDLDSLREVKISLYGLLCQSEDRVALPRVIHVGQSWGLSPGPRPRTGVRRPNSLGHTWDARNCPARPFARQPVVPAGGPCSAIPCKSRIMCAAMALGPRAMYVARRGFNRPWVMRWNRRPGCRVINLACLRPRRRTPTSPSNTAAARTPSCRPSSAQPRARSGLPRAHRP